jgi:4-carboxymuconolactone decarboxylase
MTAGRLQPLAPDALTPERRKLYDSILKGKRGTGHKGISLTYKNGALVGPFNAMLLSPQLGEAVQRVGEEVRFATSLSPHLIETVVLLVASQTGSKFEWHAHEAIARILGMTDSYIAALKARSRPADMPADVSAAWDIANDLLSTNRVSEKAYAAGVEALSERGVFELAVVIGYYRMIAGVLETFDVEIPN